MNSTEQHKTLTIKELFSQGKYIIPIYQRNYSWGSTEILQLIKDIDDKKTSQKNYYLGTLIVNNGNEDFEVIDGQQRLTTLFLICCALKKILGVQAYNFENNIAFACRDFSNNQLEKLWNCNDENSDGNLDDYKIFSGYKTIKGALEQLNQNDNLEKFKEYFLDKVKIFRAEVPEHTDLNKYFEIMNNRGEQLEKHEILKARMLNHLNNEFKHKFNLVWEACSNMEKYLPMSFYFSSNNNNCDRVKLFYKDGVENPQLITEDDFYNWLKEEETNTSTEKTIEKIIKDGLTFDDNNNKEENSEKRVFGSVVNFPNFLLIVLNIFVNSYKNKISIENIDSEISLDDKILIEEFDKFIKTTINEEEKAKQAEFVKSFCYCLIKIRFLLDKFIIKRDDKDWRLQQFKWNIKENTFYPINTFDELQNKDIIMLLSMFHVSQPSTNYKYWLNGALNYCYTNEEITYENYRKYLIELAERFLRNRFLTNNPSKYQEILYIKNFTINETIDAYKLNNGTQVENFIFNYLDYKLWNKDKNKYKNFEFTFRSSVEHFLPQSYSGVNEEIMNSFGNLCLISSSKNSEYSNKSPMQKQKEYNPQNIESIKQDIMMQKANDWERDTSTITTHGEEMQKILLTDI